MSKFCGNCGAQLDDSAKVCGYCGVALSNEQVNTNATPIPGIVSEADKEKAAKTKKFIKLGAIAIVAIIVLSVGFNIISSFTGYKGVVRKVVNAFEDYDMNTLCSYASSLSYYGDDIEYSEEVFEERVSSKLDYYEEELGHGLKISFEIIDSYKLDDRNRDDLLDELEDSGAYVGKIDTIRMVEMQLTIKGSRSTSTYTTDDLMLVKENGKWKVLYLGGHYY